MKTGENQGKKSESSDYKNSIITLLLKKKHDAKKTTKLTEMLFFDFCFNRRFYILQNQMQVFKKKKVMQLVKPIRY